MGHAESLALTTKESKRLTSLEARIESGFETFREVGSALMEIRDSRLYRASHSTFEDYCCERWGMNRNYANKLIRASAAVLELGTTVPKPSSESQVRPLLALPKEQRAEAWEMAVEATGGGTPTAAIVERAVQAVKSVDKLAPMMSSATPEHYTPARIIKATLACLGGIDLDPCSNPGAPNVPAARHFTEEHDGLSQEWSGRVYMNPPYGREIGLWIKKLTAEHAAGRVEQAIALVPARTDTDWFMALRDFVCCFVHGRLTFIGNEDAAPFPSAVFYMGENIVTFHDAFLEIGDIWQRVEREMIAE